MAEVSAAFGLGLRLHFHLPGLPPRLPPAGAPIVDLRAVSQERLLESWSGAVGEPLWETVFEGDARYVLQPGRAGDHLVHYRDRAAFHFSADGLILSCADPSGQGPEWQRMLLDTVLWSAALLHDAVLLHASAVNAPTGAIAIAAAEGSGKSSLAAQLVADGWQLLSDDIVAFERAGDRILAHAGPTLMNLATDPRAQVKPDALGRVLASFGDAHSAEAWVLVEDFAPSELPLSAIVLLRRAGTAPALVSRLTATTLDVTTHTLAFRRMAGAQKRRFEAVSDLVERVPVFCIDAGLQVPPDELAEVLRRELRRSSPIPSPKTSAKKEDE